MKQSNLLAGIAVVIGLSLIGYLGIFKSNWSGESTSTRDSASNNQSKREIFSFVPADTLFFFGGLSTISFQDAVKVINPGGDWLKHADFTQQLTPEEKADMPPAAQMISSLINSYIKLLKEPASATTKLGVDEKIDAVSYTVGFIPVVRIKLTDSTTFNKFIDEVEKYEKLSPVRAVLGDMNLRSYSFDIPGSESQSNANLIIGSNKQYAIFSVSTKIENDNSRQLIIGTRKPEHSLDAETVLEPIKNKNGFHPAFIGFVNHREIMKGLTGEGNGEFGRMLDTVLSMAGQVDNRDNGNTPSQPKGDTEKPLDAIRTEACRKELMTIISSWPQTVFGYTKLDFKEPPSTLEARMLIEGSDAEFMKSMQSIRGYIPAVLHDVYQRPVFGVGLGINVDGLSPFVAQASQDFISKEYQCDLLAQTKQSLAQTNPAMALGMMSGMVSGVQGVSLIVLDIKGKLDVTQPGAIPEIEKLDAILIISSANPQQLLTMAANFQPGMPPIPLPPDGTPIDLPLPLPLLTASPMKLALKGNHIVAYVGEKATAIANSLSQEPLKPSGIFALNIDFGKYLTLIANAANDASTSNTGDQNVSLSRDDQAILDAMSKTRMQFVESIDVKTEGITFDIKMATNQ